MLEYVKCEVCGSPEYTTVNSCRVTRQDAEIEEESLNIVKCSGCGLFYVNPRPVFNKAQKKQLYSQEYFEKDYMKFYSGLQSSESIQSNEPFSLRMDLIEKYVKTGRLLDIGCATGEFLNLARNKGWEVMGIEISDFAAEYGRKKYGLEILNGNLEEVSLPEGSFDVITASDVLEHVSTPKMFLKETGRLLKKDGILYLALPNFGGFYYRMASILARFNHRNYFVLPYHLYHFTQDSIKKLLELCSFRVLKIDLLGSRFKPRNIKQIFAKLILSAGWVFRSEDRMVLIAKKQT